MTSGKTTAHFCPSLIKVARYIKQRNLNILSQTSVIQRTLRVTYLYLSAINLIIELSFEFCHVLQNGGQIELL